MQGCISKIINEEILERWGIEIKQFKIENITERYDELSDFMRINNNAIMELQTLKVLGTEEYNKITMNKMLRNMSLTEGNMIGGDIGDGIGSSIFQNLESPIALETKVTAESEDEHSKEHIKN